MPSLWFRLVLFTSKKEEDLEMQQYNFTKGKKRNLTELECFPIECCKTKTIYIEPMGTQNQPNRLKCWKTRAPKS